MGVEAKSMEMKKIQTSSAENSLSTHKIQDFVGDIKSEIQKVHWTSKDELLAYTKIVVIATFLFGMSIYFVDMLIQGTLGALNVLLRLITG